MRCPFKNGLRRYVWSVRVARRLAEHSIDAARDNTVRSARRLRRIAGGLVELADWIQSEGRTL